MDNKDSKTSSIEQYEQSPVSFIMLVNWVKLIHFVAALLLANGFSRITLNDEGKIAYEIASTNEIHSLFHRPTNAFYSRFVDSNVCETLSILDLNDDTNNQAVFNNANDAIQSQYMPRFNRIFKLLWNIIKTIREARSVEMLEKIVKNLNSVTTNKTGDQMLLQNAFEDFFTN
ncbi:unnamed protein product [Rotaria sp. Silwood2]|nr:unnamed protein product [Rotaria sp. Silwood2]